MNRSTLKMIPLLLLATLCTPLFAVQTDVYSSSDKQIAWYWSEQDGIVGYRVTIDGLPAIDSDTWTRVLKRFPADAAAKMSEGLPLIEEEVAEICFEDCTKCGCDHVGPIDMIARVTTLSPSAYTYEIHLRNAPHMADSRIYVGFAHP